MKITKQQLKTLIREALHSESKKFARIKYLEGAVRVGETSTLFNASYELDNEDRIIIYTNLWQHPDGSVHDKPYTPPKKQTAEKKRAAAAWERAMIRRPLPLRGVDARIARLKQSS